MYIYKITNTVNKKIYIGKTNNPSRRKKEHFLKSNINNEPKKVLYLAMKKYGKENFLFEILEECLDKDWEEREKYWIKFYNSLIPNGYNMIDGGSEPPHYTGEKSPVSKLKDFEVEEIQQLLLTKTFKKLSNKEIAKRYNISIDQIRRINPGERGYNKNLNYPLRKYSKKQISEEIIELLSTWKYSCQEIADMYNVSKSCIKEINRGKNHFKEGIVYPIKPTGISGEKTQYKKAYELLKKNYSITEIIKQTKLKHKTIYSIKEGKYNCYLETCND